MAERYADQLFDEKGIVKLTLERTPGGKWMDELGLFELMSDGRKKYEVLERISARCEGYLVIIERMHYKIDFANRKRI